MTIAELQSKWHFASRKDPLYFIPSIILPLSIMPLSCIMDYSATAHLADNVDNKDRELSPDKRHFHIPLTWTLHSGKPTMESWTIRIKQYCMTLTTYTRQSAKNSKSMTSMTMTDNQQAKPIILNNSHQVSAVKLGPLFGPFCSKFNSAAKLSVCSTFFSALFDLCREQSASWQHRVSASNKNHRQQGTAVIGCLVFVHWGTAIVVSLRK